MKCDPHPDKARSVGRPVDILVINLDRSPARLAFQEAQFEQLGIGFERVPGVDGAQMHQAEYRRWAFLWERTLTHSEVGCALGHQACWERVADRNRNAIILEDDIVLGAEFPDFAAKASVVEGSVAINLESRFSLRYLGKAPVGEATLGPYALFDLVIGTPGAGAYLVTPQAAKTLLQDYPKRGGLADAFLWTNTRIRRRQLDPAIAATLDHLVAHTGTDGVAAARTTIARPTFNAVRWLMHPAIGMKRVGGQARLGIDKLVAAPWSVKRRVDPLPSVVASFQSLKGIIGHG